MLSIKDLNESLERKYFLTEKVNHENDEINDRIRGISRKGFNRISDEDKKFLAQNGVRVSPAQTRNERPIFYGKGRAFKDNNGRYGDRYLDGYGREFSNEKGNRIRKIDPPDTRNDKVDIKGWLDTEKYGRPATASEIDKSLRPYSDEARKQLKWAEEGEKEARMLGLENEAEIANRLEDKDIYGNATFGGYEYNSEYRTGRTDYNIAHNRRQQVSDMVRKQKEKHSIHEGLGYNGDTIMTSSSGMFSLGIASGIGMEDTPYEELRVDSSGLAEQYAVEIRIETPFYQFDGQPVRRKAYPNGIEVVHGMSGRRETLKDTVEYIGVLQEAVEFAKQISDFIRTTPEWNAKQ